ncbi:MAG: hypothetical protein A2Y98_03220 [Candidatus Portnoybacteria bacterium RBG_19FT_COMBO_36_7]|uniref:Uncharacterized protein n=1 Tax=Candidatus Portnoybacteria bacterium RBG_19FT_COMBO_36_7 TaxID=1801992 RepID=A0A1G2F6Z5_9BACT|nr:MAG: hypothetical protein A2Y98_03220 [Candidatus Portnoybacteria bacterium RBG_19FT_COMBO_36_7]
MLKDLSIKKSKKGLTLLDVMIAVGLALVGLVGIIGVLRYVIILGSQSSDKFIASNLAQEGIELVRFYRDSKWLNDDGSYYLRDNMTGPGDSIFPISEATDYKVDYTLDPSESLLLYDPDEFLKLNPNPNSNFYQYSSGTDTKFKRKITIIPHDSTVPTGNCKSPGTGILYQCVSVVSRVTWDNHEIVVEDWLYNWMPH